MEKNIVPEALTKTATENKFFDNAGPEELIEPKVPVEEHIVTERGLRRQPRAGAEIAR